MSSIEKEFDTRGAKKSKLRLSLKLPSLGRNRSTSSPLERSASTGAEFPERSNLRRIREEDDKASASSDSDDSYDSEEEMKKFQNKGGRRRSLSTSAMDDVPKSDSEDETDGDSKQRAGSVSSTLPHASKTKRPDSPTITPFLAPKSCLRLQTRRRSTSMSEVEEILQNAHHLRNVHFSPDTVDPPPRNCKYREYCERKLGLNFNVPNVKHEQHKQRMKQIKKVDLSDYMSSHSKGYRSTPVFSPMSGGGMMMM